MAGVGDVAREGWKAHGALVLVQIMGGGYHVLSKVALNGGVSKIVFCIFRGLIALSLLAHLAYVREKQVRPPMTRRFLISFIFLGLTGTEIVNLFRIEGQMQVAGTVAYASGAVLMAVFRGPTVVGYKESGLASHIELSSTR
ncbi:hypothetical protein Ancab_033168 [Ancistrocladus abbreviatus]